MMKWITCFFTILSSFSIINGFVTRRSIQIQTQTHLPSISNALPNHHHIIEQRRQQQRYAVPDKSLHWFVKTEQFSKPFPEVKPHLEAHREWVRKLRESNPQMIVSGYRVDENDRPGGGGLMIFAAKDYESAEKLVRNDPLVANECVDWQLNKWIAETGDISIE